MELVYHGVHDEVEVAGTGHIARRDGDPIDVIEDVAKRLLEQVENWKKPEATAAKPATAPDDTKAGS